MKTKICKHCGSELKELAKTIKVKELNIEIETEIHDKGKTFNEIKIPKGWRLPTYFELQTLRNDKRYRYNLNLLDTWEFVEQLDEMCKKKDYIAWFGAYSGGAVLGCYGDPSDSDAGLGVRFVRDLT